MLPPPTPFDCVISTSTPQTQRATTIPVRPAAHSEPADAAPSPMSPELFKKLIDALVVEDKLARAPLVYDFATLNWRGRVPLLLNHQRGILGWVEEVHVADSSLCGSGLLTNPMFPADLVGPTAAAGFPWRTSLRVNVDRCDLDEVAEGESCMVNGRELQGPLVVGRNWELVEVSIVLDPLDPGTSFTVNSSHVQMSKERSHIDILNPSSIMLNAAPVFTDDTGQTFRVAIDDGAAELAECAARVCFGSFDDSRYFNAVLADRDTLENMLFCLSVGPSGRRGALSLESFRDRIKSAGAIDSARVAFLAALSHYQGRVALISY